MKRKKTLTLQWRNWQTPTEPSNKGNITRYASYICYTLDMVTSGHFTSAVIILKIHNHEKTSGNSTLKNIQNTLSGFRATIEIVKIKDRLEKLSWIGEDQGNITKNTMKNPWLNPGTQK